MSRSFDIPQTPALSEQDGSSFASLVSLMQRLLAPDGCPWDREQTPLSLRRYVLEEACEVIDAIEAEDHENLSEELGDLALQVAFLAELSRREGRFGPDDVMRKICEKLVHRHPHVFGDVEVEDADAVAQNWDEIKRQEKGRQPLLAKVPRSFPALQRAQRLSELAARVGFDWPDAGGSHAKVKEELGELDEARASGDTAALEDEFGDVLFALVNWGRHLGIRPDAALQKTCDKFARRFGHVEQSVCNKYEDWPRDERGKATSGVPLAELDAYWNEAKSKEAQ